MNFSSGNFCDSLVFCCWSCLILGTYTKFQGGNILWRWWLWLDDNFLSGSLTDGSLSKLSHRQSCSHNNQAHMITQQSAAPCTCTSTHYSLTYASSPPATPTKCHDPEHVAVRTRTSHQTLQQLKCYNIHLRRGVRLSNSTPNLPSMLSLHSPVLQQFVLSPMCVYVCLFVYWWSWCC